MFEDRSPKFDVVALVLAVASLLGALALVSYDAADPPGGGVWPARAAVQNACGTAGAYFAHTMLEMLGVGAYYAVGSLAVLSGLLLARREVDQPVVRTLGWALSLGAIATLAAILLPSWSPGPLVGAGGYVGAMGRAWLESNFATAGGVLLTLALLLAGLLLSTDYFVFRAAAATAAASTAGLAGAGALGRAARERFAARRTDLDSVAAEPRASRTPAKAASTTIVDDAEADADDDEADEEWDYDEDESADEVQEYEDDAEAGEQKQPKKKGLGKRLAAALRVKTPEVVAATAAVAVAGGAALAAAAADGDDGEEPRSVLKKPKSKSARDEIIDQLQAADQGGAYTSDYELPPLDLLLPADDVSYDEHEREVRRKAQILEKTFQDFGFNVKVVEVETGPVIAQYEVELEAGLRLSKITGLADDLAIALRAPSVRIVAPIPGKNTVGIEAPNDTRQIVRLREVIEETDGQARRMKIPIYLGKDVGGNPMVVDLAALPHLLIAGRTGTGKSVCLNSIIVSILMSRGPDEVRMLMIDPKMVELSGYRKLPHLMHPVVTDMKKAEAILGWAVDKMEERYALLARAGVRHISVYNQLSEAELRERLEPENDAEWGLVPKQLPFIVIVADEIADLMMTAGKDVEQHIIRLAQKSRAVGIHLILATQKPTVDVITGLIKSNLPARIAFQVASRTDSRVVLDEMGADKLLGNGDMLFLSPGTSQLLRGQGTYVSDDEITRVVNYVGTDDQQFAVELMQLKEKDAEEGAAGPAGLKNRDELYEAAVDVVVRERRGSVSLLQRCLGIGYGRAARLIDFMAEDGIVGDYNGSQAREILLTLEEWEAMSKGGAPAPASAKKSTAIPAATPPWEEEGDELEDQEGASDDESADEGELGEDEEWVYEDEEAEDDEAESDDEEGDDEEEAADGEEEWEYEDEAEDASDEWEDEEETGEDDEEGEAA
ncbi:MAG: DNA translocase FtsK [Lacipirellulaceae bacterium]